MKKGVLQIMLANIIYLLISVVTNFLLPKYLDIESYAEIKSFILYTNYAGFFHLGLIDGVYLKYGGTDLQYINKDECKKDIVGLILLEFLFAILILCIGIFNDDKIVQLYSVGMFAFNLLSFFRNFYQATGAFHKYSMVLNSETTILFFCYIIFISLCGIYNDSLPYIIVRIVIMSILCIYCYRTLKLHKSSITSIINICKNAINNIKQGILLMLGNFATVCFSGIDRWFVLLFINQRSFAIYAFAVSIEQAINTFVSPITLSMYNYLCKHDDIIIIKKIKNITMIWGLLIISGGFLAKYIINTYLPKYNDATMLIFILFAAMAIHTIIKGIYLNVYKAKRKQNIYCLQMVSMIIIAILLDFICYQIFKNMICIAIATFIVSIIWLIICEIYDKHLQFNLKEFFVLSLTISIYIFCGYIMSPVIGFGIYLSFFIIIMLIFMKKECYFLLESIQTMFNKSQYNKDTLV